MKFVVGQFKIGDTVQGRVEELLAGDEVLICFDGDLLRVHNESKQVLKIGDQVTLQVTAIQPLRFRLPPKRRRKPFGHFDINI